MRNVSQATGEPASGEDDRGAVVKTYRAQVASREAYVLGEGPVWDEPTRRVLWVDVQKGLVLEGELRADSVEPVRRHTLPGTVGAVVPATDGGLLVAARDGLATIAPDGRLDLGPRLLPDTVDSRLNDGACDPAGRFLVGGLSLDDRRHDERLYRLESDGSVSVLADKVTLSNGLGWSPDGRTMYHVDSVPGIVWSTAYDPATGEVGEWRELLSITDGTPDGLCVDVEGNLWIAIWGCAEVRRYTPRGELLATVAVPAPHTSSVAFVGAERDRLLITTARDGLSEADLDAYPDSGRLFLADVGTAGLPTPRWNGDTATPPWRG
jgi:sugar lactone lactonase YvrE